MTTLPRSVDAWPAQQREEYEERAAIMEFDGQTPRDQAEIDAEFDVRKHNYES